MRGTRQRTRRNKQETLSIGNRLVGFELVRRYKTPNRMVFACRLQVLADGKKIDVLIRFERPSSRVLATDDGVHDAPTDWSELADRL